MALNLVSKEGCECVSADFYVHNSALDCCFSWFLLLWLHFVHLWKLGGSSEDPLMKVMCQPQRINGKSYAFFPLSDLPYFWVVRIRKEHVGMREEALFSFLKNPVPVRLLNSICCSLLVCKRKCLPVMSCWAAFRFFWMSPFLENTGILLCGSWKQLFSWLWIVVFISVCCRFPAARNLSSRLQLPNCAVTHLFADSHQNSPAPHLTPKRKGFRMWDNKLKLQMSWKFSLFI